jgi:hypothetical protein
VTRKTIANYRLFARYFKGLEFPDGHYLTTGVEEARNRIEDDPVLSLSTDLSLGIIGQLTFIGLKKIISSKVGRY